MKVYNAGTLTWEDVPDNETTGDGRPPLPPLDADGQPIDPPEGVAQLPDGAVYNPATGTWEPAPAPSSDPVI